MNLELTDWTWLDERTDYSLADLAACSRFTEAELMELVEYGLIAPSTRAATQFSFAGTTLTVVKTAARVRRDFELDLHGAAVAMSLLERINRLEIELRQLKMQTVR